MQLELQSDFTPYTCDTYATFTDDMFLESELDYLNEKSEKEITSDDIEIEYNMQGIVGDMGEILASFLVDNYEYINKASVQKIHIPKFYNYCTDAVTLDIDCDINSIVAYCNECDDFNEYMLGEAMGYSKVSELEKYLIFYIRDYSTDEMVNNYQASVYDVLCEIYSENTKITLKTN